MADNDTENEIQIFYELMYSVVQSINRLAKIFKESDIDLGEGDIDEGSYDYVYGNEKPTEVEMKFASQSEIPLKLQQELHNYYSFVLDIENKTADLVNSLTAKDAPYTERDEIIHLNAFYQKVAFVRKGIGEALGVMNEIESLISDAEFDRNI